MSYGWRILAAAALSVLAHVLLARGAELLPTQSRKPPPEVARVRLIETPPPKQEPAPDPTPEPEPEPVAPTKPIEPHKVRRRPRPPIAVATPVTPEQPSTPTERPAVGGDPATPRFGVSLESTSRAGPGPAVPIGNTLQVRPDRVANKTVREVEPLPAPVEAHAVTRMPLPRGRCTGRYTTAARNAGTEGTVILDIVVGANGLTRQIKVVQRLSHGLTAAAIKAVQACQFRPGERDGIPVAVRVRAFKIRFFLQDND